MGLSFLTSMPEGCKKKRSHRDFSRSRKLMLLHRSSKLEKVKGDDKPLCSSDNVIDLYEKEKTNDCQADTAVNASNSKISEKLLPLNKRKSRYYVLQEDDGNAKLTNEENSWSESEEEGHVKIQSLSSIYKRARMVPNNFDLY